MKYSLMKVSDIKVTSAFRRTTPRSYKMDACREYYKQNGRIDKPIIVSRSGYVLDGYIRYLILKEKKIDYSIPLSKSPKKSSIVIIL